MPFQEVYDEVASKTCLGYIPSSEEIAGAAPGLGTSFTVVFPLADEAGPAPSRRSTGLPLRCCSSTTTTRSDGSPLGP